MIHRAILTWFPPLWKKNRTLFFRYSEQKAENYSIRRAIKVPVNTREQKNNVGTQKMHMTHSRLKPGFEGINKHGNWLRPAGQETKKVHFCPLKVLKFCMNKSLLNSCSRLQKPELWMQSQKSCCLLLSQSPYKLSSAQGWRCLPCSKTPPRILCSSVLFWRLEK